MCLQKINDFLTIQGRVLTQKEIVIILLAA